MSKKRQYIKQEDKPVKLITDGMKQHLKYLAELSILVKLIIVIITILVFRSGMDMYAIAYYYDHAVSIFNGSYPYVSFYYEYPILIFIPVAIALIPSLILNSLAVFMVAFSGLMIICDCITTMCIYLISRKIWGDPKIAFISAFLYITALSTAYFAMIDCSSFAVCLFMIGLTLLFYGKDIFGFSRLTDYSLLVFGYFAKIFPAIALPFVILYKSRMTSLKYEIVSALKILIPVSFILFIPTFILNPSSTIKTYLPMRLDVGYFPNTIIWTLYVWLHDIFAINITMENVLVFIYVCMISGLLLLMYTAFKYKGQEPVVLIKFILCAIIIVVLSFKTRSPGYAMWFMPLVCILAADNIYKIGMFYIVQMLAYIEFPLAFWILWTNLEYTNPIYSTNWYLALTLFTIEFSTLLILIWIVINPIQLYKKVFSF